MRRNRNAVAFTIILFYFILFILVGGRGGNASCTLVPHGHRVAFTSSSWCYSQVLNRFCTYYWTYCSHVNNPPHRGFFLDLVYISQAHCQPHQ